MLLAFNLKLWSSKSVHWQEHYKCHWPGLSNRSPVTVYMHPQAQGMYDILEQVLYALYQQLEEVLETL